MTGVNILFIDSVGDSVSVLRAQSANYDVAAGILEAKDSVVVSTTEGSKLQTAHAFYELSANVIRSDSSYVLVSGGSSRQTSGNGFTFAPKLTRVAGTGATKQ